MNVKNKPSAHNYRDYTFVALVIALLLSAWSIMAYKLYVLDYPLAGLIPATSYQIDVNIETTGHGDDISVSTYLPRSDNRQHISKESNSSGLFNLSIENDSLNRLARWEASNVQGRQNIRYSYSVEAKHIRYAIPSDMMIPRSYPDDIKPYLQEAPGVQVNDPLIEETLQKLFPGGPHTLLNAITTIHRHLQDDFANKNFSGFTDAITALKLGEASCNGKSRLFLALARKLNIPARLVGGLIMQAGNKRTSHQWVEVYIAGHWVPFDTINDHFADIPANYLTLYYGDLVLFKHTSNINFNYSFNMVKRLVPKREALESLDQSGFNIFNLYTIFEQVGISQNLLKIILMIPLGALVVVIFRNVIGIQTFGTFLPALIAAAARETGLLWGAIGFILIILVSSIVRKLLDWLQLLHSPKMAIMLSTVVIVMMSMTVISVHFGLFELAHVTLFPIAVLAITAERFAIIESEQGSLEAFRITAWTILVISACYVVMESLFLQSMILAFPELLLVVITLNLWLGKWVGMRVTEFVRFRKLIFSREVK
ncbi:MAG TPA: transglutaminase [Chromatiales bacterium]|nr:transglutaminase [Chromatiales bacterium]